MDTRSIVCGAALAACVALPALAGSGDIRFTRPEHFIDAGDTPAERNTNLKILSDELQALAARRLPADQSLQVEVLEVDMAGRIRDTQRGGVRIARDDRDGASISLRYTLLANGQTLRSGEATLSELSAHRPLNVAEPAGPLKREKRLLASWFTKEFGGNPR